MQAKDQKEKIKIAESYLGKHIILKNPIKNGMEKTFTLVGYKLVSYGDIKDFTSPNKNINEYSSSLFGVLYHEEDEINNISMDLIVDAIEKNKTIEYSI